MAIATILEGRFSTRAFLPDPVPQDILHSLFEAAQRSPSNCNVQPWQSLVVSEKAKDKLSQALLEEILSGKEPYPDFDWNVKYQGVHRERQIGAANALYTAMGIARDNKPARQMAMGRNWLFFDAPHAVFFAMDLSLGIMGAVDLGIYAQTLSLAMAEQDISSCMQGALGQFPGPIKQAFNLPEGCGILFGMSFGYADQNNPVNDVRTSREDISKSVIFKS